MQHNPSTVSSHPDDEFVDLDETCIFWGGGRRPINRATVYRQIAKGLHPKPVIGSLSRWSLNELRAERQRRMNAR